jgi:GTP-binding protein Era
MKGFKSGFLAVVGKPNVGKSTLVNLLLQFPLAVVTPKPQTTRNKVLGVISGENYQIAIWDTPGLFKNPRHDLHRLMLEEAWSTLENADVVLMVTEPKLPEEEDILIVEKLKDHTAILAINKIDLVRKVELLPLIEHYSKYDFKEIVPISALKGINIDQLLETIVKYLPEGEPLFPEDFVTDRSERFFVGEIIRGVIFEHYGEEIPYSTAVKIEEFVEKDPEKGGKDYIRAIIFVEKESQKPIILGKKGVAIKKVGTVARQRIEAFLGRPVYLELWVKVKSKWRKDPLFLRSLRSGV